MWDGDYTMADRLAVGAQVGSYRVTSLIGASVRGGREMSVVYRAEHVRLGTAVALKVLAPEWSDDEAFKERFLHDVNLAATIDHPNVIPIYDADVHDGSLYVVMRLVAGGGLKALLARTGPLDPEVVPAALGPVAKALDAAHERKLVHGGVKPSNVLLHWSRSASVDHVYLSDFGMPPDLSAESEMSQIGTTTDMFDYVSPEQVEGEPATAKSDVYSLGCVVYHSLTGRVPLTPGLTRFAGPDAGIDPPSHLRPVLPPEVDAPVLEAMSRDPGQRPDTCEHVTRRLAEALGVESGSIRGPWTAGVSAPLGGATAHAGLTALRPSPRPGPEEDAPAADDGAPAEAAASAPPEVERTEPSEPRAPSRARAPEPAAPPAIERTEPSEPVTASRAGAPEPAAPPAIESTEPSEPVTASRARAPEPTAPPDVERPEPPEPTAPAERLPAPAAPPPAARSDEPRKPPPPPPGDGDGDGAAAAPHGPHKRRVSGKTLALLGAALVAAVGGYGVSTLRGGDDGTGSQAQAPGTNPPATTGAGPVQQIVAERLPDFRCTVTRAAPGGQVLEHANCVPRRRDDPPIDRVTLTRFGSEQAMEDFFERSRTLATVSPRRSDEPCTPGPTWGGQGRWFRDRGGERLGGRMFCFTPDEDAPTDTPRITWTVEASTILGEATAPDSGDLSSWWTRERNLTST